MSDRLTIIATISKLSQKLVPSQKSVIGDAPINYYYRPNY